MASVTDYTNLVTSEHASKPNFIATLSLVFQPLVDNINLLNALPSYFDIDMAVGVQLDTLGEWIGQSRYLSVPLTNVYFSLDTVGLGLDEGTWQGPYDPSTGLVALSDSAYRTLLRAKIAANQWDGTIPSAYQFMAAVFPNNTFFIQDNGDMTMYVGVVGNAPLDAVTYSLLTNGYLDIKPIGVTISGYVTSSVLGSPVFGLDVNNSTIGGLDSGVWATITGGR